ncbi:uncharacterized protein LOC131299694 [Rhododendron vialii]|uniref:uncharacterized protein LOC131299694 n=1 Tax=Rhododendron vialii TaxID=182163 RepID=UPI00265FD84C|nr:uncharacterized protein LOC131299694 [Rhododendron vialii]
MRMEFLNLRQGNMSVGEYQLKFNELSRFAGGLVEKEANKVWHFQRGLHLEIHGMVSLLNTKTLPKLVTRTLTVETDLADEKRSTENHAKRFRPGQGNGGGFTTRNVRPATQANEGLGQASRPCFKCGKPHAALYRCDGSVRVCFSCGQPGHTSTHCRARGDGRNQISQGQRQPVRGGGHDQQRQFNNQGNHRQQAQIGGQGQRNVTEGRVYALTQQQAKDVPSMVQGTLSISNVPARVLFDSGSTHSFAAPRYLYELPIVVEALEVCVVVTTPVGKTVTLDKVSKSCDVEIDDRILPIDLISLEMHDFDVILGMD